MGDVIDFAAWKRAKTRAAEPAFTGFVDCNQNYDFIVGNHIGWLNRDGGFCARPNEPEVVTFPTMTRAKGFLALAGEAGLAAALIELEAFTTPSPLLEDQS